MTTQAFITDPKWTNQSNGALPSRRFYKTGDLVYQEADGSFVFVARKDTQVKVGRPFFARPNSIFADMASSSMDKGSKAAK
jgi:non-ribosomal peptide synthetase component F